MKYKVCVVPATATSAPVKLAAKELVHWLSTSCTAAEFAATKSVERADFVLGTFEDIAGVLGEQLCNDQWHDEILIRSIDGRLIIAGSNPRSVLFALYTYLDNLGFAWIVPGAEGEIVPRLKEIPLEGYDIRHRASLLYRGFGLAGAYDVVQGQEFIEWMARNRFNHLFIEGHTARALYQQALEREVSLAEARRYDRQLVRAAKEHGLIFESAGHGWTAWTLGIPPHAPYRKEYHLAEELRPMAAELNGRRGLYENSPGNTHLCLSNPQSHKRMTELVCEYAKAHSEIDVLAVWLADGMNNWCECSDCAKVHPSDLWVQLINRLSHALYEVRPELKVEVLGYSGLMEPPPTQRIDNSRGNVVFMYAPFIRCYLHALDDPNCTSDWPIHRFPPANQWGFPMNRAYFEYFREWREKFEGTNYVFDYYCWLPIKRDIFEGNVPETLCHDMKSYPAHGINGCVDCSRAQSFWPTPLARWVQARASWDASVDYEQERSRLLKLTFGDYADVVDEYLALTYQCLLPDHHGREEERAFAPDKVRRYKRSLPAVRRKLDEAIVASRGVRKKNLQRVTVHADFTRLHLDCLLAESDEKYDQAIQLANEMHALATKNARLLAGVADPPEFSWLKDDTIERLQAKKAGTYVRIG